MSPRFEIEGLAAKNVVTRVSGDAGGFMSSLFLVPKADSSWWPVLNLKPLNHSVVSPHFKMESARSVKNLVQPGNWLIKLDLKYAYLYNSTDLQTSPVLPQVSVAVDSVALHGAALQPELSPTYLHQDHETSGGRSWGSE